MTIESTGMVRCQFGQSNDFKMSVTPGQWQHLACVWDGGAMYSYKNGQLAGEKHTAIELSFVQAELMLGNDAEGGKALSGRLDLSAVWRRARSAAELCEAAGELCP